MTTATQTPATTRSGVKVVKHIYDWDELVPLIERQHRPATDSEISERARRRYMDTYGNGERTPFAQIDDRTFARPTRQFISLVYFRTPPGCDELELQEGVTVFPAAGGRTTYKIDRRLDGHFCNRMLPMKAKDRKTQSRYADYLWYCGRSQVYTEGVGMYYPDVGPDCTNLSRATLTDQIRAGIRGWSQELTDAAIDLVEVMAKKTAAFPDIRTRYETYSPNDHRPSLILSRPHAKWHGQLNFAAEAGLRIRLKSPCSDDGHSTMVPDLCIAVSSKPGGCTMFADVMYALELLMPSGPYAHHNAAGAWPVDDFLSDKCKAFISAAEQWCADHVYIPA